MWDLVEKAEFSLPSTTFDETIKTTLGSILLKFRNNYEKTPFMQVDDLIPFSETMKNRLVPNPDWHQAIQKLDNLFTDKLSSEENIKTIDVIVSQPNSSTHEVIERWAKKSKLDIVPFPSERDILENYESWIESNGSNSKLIVINGLEKFFFAHHFGLNLIRNLVKSLFDDERSCLIHINSWAWNYLETINLVPKEEFLKIRFVKPFNGEELKIWINELTKFYKKKQISFRKTNTGQYLIFHEEGDKKLEAKNIDLKFFNNLAAFSLGIPIIALKYWRMGIRVAPDEQLIKELEEEESVEGSSVVWIIPWEKIPRIEIRSKLETSEEQILWYVLMHQPLKKEILIFLMKNYIESIHQSLSKLMNYGLIVIAKDIIEINSMAYPIIGKYLLNEGYLSDGIKG